MTDIFIRGEWEAAAGISVFELIDPGTSKPLEPIRSASRDQRQRAIEAARGALQAWMQRSAEDRATLVSGVADEIRQAAGALAERQAVESGQPLRECQDLVAAAVRRLASATAAEPADIQVRRMSPQALWSFWVSVLSAVAGGSTVVCELPADRAMTALAVARCAQRLPAGVLNVLTVEAHIEPATDTATEFVFVGQDCYLDVAVAGAATLRLYNTGQRTGQSTRIHVEAPLAYKFADRLHEYLAFLEAGDPRKPVTDLGPLRDATTLQTATERLAKALKQGALVKLGGRPYQPWGLRGYFLQPTLLIEGVGAERVPHETIAGPVVIVSPTADMGAALRESVGPSHGPLRLVALTGQSEKLVRSLRAAAFTPRTGAYHPLVDRGWEADTTNSLAVELIQGPQPDWFPYKNRRGLKL
jgi:acyl-CoA reductase-like NAD-dependent aldehyde dehydrogenase